jgi:hypothetical protein
LPGGFLVSSRPPFCLSLPNSSPKHKHKGKKERKTRERKKRVGKKRENSPNQNPTTILLPLTPELPPPMVISIPHSFRLQKLRTVDEIPEGVEAEAEVFGGVHAVATLVARAFVVGVEG